MTHIRAFGSTLSLLLSLLVLVPRVGLAAEELPASSSASGALLIPDPSGLPGTSEPSPLRLSEDSGAPQSKRWRAPRGLRILSETGASLLTSAALGGAGYMAGYALCLTGIFGSPDGQWRCIGPVGIGGVLGLALGVPLGVFWGGELTGGDGKLYGALLGMVSGLAAGVLLSVAIDAMSAFYIISLPFMVGGSIVGYELTTRDVPVPQPSLASSRPRLQPVLAFSSRGALLGLGGSF